MKMYRALAAGLALAGSLWSMPAIAEPHGDDIKRIMHEERRVLGAIPHEKLQDLITPRKGARDAIYDRAWLAAQPGAKGGAQWQCLAQALYFEARGETLRGQFAVAEVILNRVDSADWPDSICDVIRQGTGRKFACQFTYTCDGRAETIAEPAAFTRVGKVARLMIDGAPRRLTDGATHYHTHQVSPRWARKFARTATIGVHHFYRAPTRLSSN